MTMPAHVVVRAATLSDAERIAELSTQLGYPATTLEARKRLEGISAHCDHAVLVAEIDGEIVGWMHVLVAHSLTADTPVEVSGLVVDENFRSRGIGLTLMKEAEAWARSRKCDVVRLRSNEKRERAHAFYERIGYRLIKISKTFLKEVEKRD